MRLITAILICCAGLFAQGDYVVKIEDGPVIGKPYSATQVTHVVQTLADGSHIDRTTTNLVYQDAQGRFRLETTDGRKQVSIRDAAAGVYCMLDLEHKTARKILIRPVKVAGQNVAGDVSPAEEARGAARRNTNGQVVEDLGSATIDGVLALGVRVTTTIPVGAIGNDRELKSVTERWYSNDIHAMVKTVTTDPRSGTYTFELTNIVRAEPDPDLFEIPAGFTVTTAGNKPVPETPQNQ